MERTLMMLPLLLIAALDFTPVLTLSPRVCPQNFEFGVCARTSSGAVVSYGNQCMLEVEREKNRALQVLPREECYRLFGRPPNPGGGIKGPSKGSRPCPSILEFGVCARNARGEWKSFPSTCQFEVEREERDRTLQRMPAEECRKRFGGPPPLIDESKPVVCTRQLEPGVCARLSGGQRRSFTNECELQRYKTEVNGNLQQLPRPECCRHFGGCSERITSVKG